MEQITALQLKKWTAGVLKGPEGAGFVGVTTDSRRAGKGLLFIALPGEKFDGHDYVKSALEAGCEGALVSIEMDPPEGKFLVRVEDTYTALSEMACAYRGEFSIPVVGVTGSVGKTTTKEYIAAVLSQQFQTCKTQGNFNNNIGLPLSVLGLNRDDEAAVFEMGMNHFGEIEQLSLIASPTIGVITNIGVAHIENLGSREGILEAKLEILTGMDDDGVLLLNGDEPLLYELKGKLSRRTLYFGVENPDCEFRAVKVERTARGQRFVVEGLINFEAEITQPGAHNIRNALCAAACGYLCGVPTDKIARGLLTMQNISGRQQRYVQDGVIILDDCYNANPDSMKAALSVLAEEEGRKIAVLGDMLELGPVSKQAHRALGKQLKEAGAAFVFLKGEEMKQGLIGCEEAGFSPESLFWSNDDEELTRKLLDTIQAGDTVLFKGSRGMKLERLIEGIKRGNSND